MQTERERAYKLVRNVCMTPLYSEYMTPYNNQYVTYLQYIELQ